MDEYTLLVDAKEIASTAEEVSTKTATMKSTFSEMKSGMQETVSNWTGDAAERHRALLGEQLRLLEALIVKYGVDAEKLAQIAGHFAEAKQRVASQVEELPSDVLTI